MACSQSQYLAYRGWRKEQDTWLDPLPYPQEITSPESQAGAVLIQLQRDLAIVNFVLHHAIGKREDHISGPKDRTQSRFLMKLRSLMDSFT